MDPYQQGRRRDGDRLLSLEEPIGGIEWPRQGVTCTPRPSPKVRMRSISEPTLAPRTEAILPLLYLPSAARERSLRCRSR